MAGRLKQKLYEALLALIREGSLNNRLTHAGMYLIQLPAMDIPDDIREEFERVKAELTATPLGDSTGYIDRDFSDAKGKELAESILHMFVDLSGGL